MEKNNQGDSVSAADEVSIKVIILKIKAWRNYLASRWKVIVLAGVIGAAIGITYAFLRKPIYKAELSFALQDEKSGGGLSGALGIASQFGIDVGSGGAGGEFSGDNLLELMRSRSMVEQTLLTPVTINGKKQTLADYYIDFNEFRDIWKGKRDVENVHFFPGADRAKFTLTQDSLLGEFHRNIIKTNLLVDKVDKKLSIISLKCISKNELFSKYFTEVLATVVSDFYIKTKTKKEVQNVDILKRQTDSVRRELNYAISGVAEFSDAIPNANPYLQRLHVPSQRRQVDVQANTAILGEMVRNLELAKMSLLQETPLIQIIDKPILPLEKDRVGKLKGIIVGGLVGVILAIFLLSFFKLYKSVMS